MRVGILYICTGAYTVFWPDFFQSFQQNFLPGVEKTYYVFTDAERIDHDDDPAVRRIYQKAYEWPYSTLKRFEVFLQAEEELHSCDYLFFANANLLCTAKITPEEVLPRPEKGEELVVACHLGYWHKKPFFLPYDRNPRSRAYMPYNAGQVYVAGGFNGGTADAFLRLCHTLNDRTEADLADGVIARWHDESQLNRLVAEQPRRFRVLDPGYCMPEDVDQPFAPRLLVRQKSKWINVGAIKHNEGPRRSFFRRKWEAACENYLPYLLCTRDTLLGKKVESGK